MVKRDIFEKVVAWLEEERVIVLKGARKTGKTTLLLQLSVKDIAGIVVQYL
jgi:predicted AAA+ superfamily ATPase